ncbi:MAG TPA: DUF4136 domain-containing protein [Gemmatimonadaceae bacterium]|nr:DUF4136 domain-containing protein [Gemmatimonadaceae bacterium]
MRATALLGLALGAVLAGCASARVATDWDPRARFAGYHSYAWVDTPRMQAMQQGTLFDRRLRSAVEEQLAAKGLRRSEANGEADVLLAYHVGVQDRLNVQQWGYAGRRLDVREYQEGALVIDIVDARSKSLVWRGTAAGELTGPDRSGEKLAKAVQKMFADFPRA